MDVPATGLIPTLIDTAYLLAAVLFILGLKRLSSPATARSGNLLGALGMLIAVVATLFSYQILSFSWIIAGLVVGAGIGLFLARTVEMTAMPQLVAVFNGFGGGASAVVAAAEYLRVARAGGLEASGVTLDVGITIMLSVLIGSVTFSGSFIAFGKLQGIVTERAVTYPGQQFVNGLIFLGIIAVGVLLVVGAPNMTFFIALAAASLVLGVLFVIPIGGADMPVVVALLNSYSGLAASATGFVLSNNVLIIAGALVGASGLILTSIMCKAMNRSLTNVLFSAFGSAAAALPGSAADDGKVAKDIQAEDVAILLAYARNVVIVPGYGMAVAQAQHQVRELAEILGDKNVDVKFAIHPVAGRMPGHMNVLLAEANVPYDQLWEMEQINPELDHTDVAVVLGANDVVNPDAREDPSSPLAGMPIINVDKADNVIVMKRSLNPGFAGVDNPLFYADNTSMFFGDAKESLTDLLNELKRG